LALLSLLLVPYTLPRMHDRYFFPADVLSLAYVAYFPAFFAIPVIVNLSSLFPYITYLFGQEVVPLSLLAIVVSGVIARLAWQLVQLVRAEDAVSSSVHAVARGAIIKAEAQHDSATDHPGGSS
jgi:Gpi18-like mannosyltransferase